MSTIEDDVLERYVGGVGLWLSDAGNVVEATHGSLIWRNRGTFHSVPSHERLWNPVANRIEAAAGSIPVHVGKEEFLGSCDGGVCVGSDGRVSIVRSIDGAVRTDSHATLHAMRNFSLRPDESCWILHLPEV